MSKVTLTDGSPVTPDHREIDPTTGQQKGYIVLSAETAHTVREAMGLYDVPCNGCTKCCHNDAVRLLPHEDATHWETEPHPYMSGALMLAHKPNGDCHYLGAQGCSIHSDKPQQCREMDCRRIAQVVTWTQARKLAASGCMRMEIWQRGRELLRSNVGSGAADTGPHDMTPAPLRGAVQPMRAWQHEMPVRWACARPPFERKPADPHQGAICNARQRVLTARKATARCPVTDADILRLARPYLVRAPEDHLATIRGHAELIGFARAVIAEVLYPSGSVADGYRVRATCPRGWARCGADATAATCVEADCPRRVLAVAAA